jgi:hypothetical protein
MPINASQLDHKFTSEIVIASGHANIVLTKQQQQANTILISGSPDAAVNIIFNSAMHTSFTIKNNTAQTLNLCFTAGSTLLTILTNTIGEIVISNSGMEKISSGSSSGSVYTATITTTWSGSSAPYTQDVTATGLTSSTDFLISPVYDANNATALLQETAWSGIDSVVSGTDKITCTCFSMKPVTAIPVKIKVVL